MTTIPERIRENVARAIYEAHPWGDEDAGTNKWELLGLEWQDAYLKMADAALDAANPLLLAAEKRGREEARATIIAAHDLLRADDRYGALAHLPAGGVECEEMVGKAVDLLATAIRTERDKG